MISDLGLLGGVTIKNANVKLIHRRTPLLYFAYGLQLYSDSSQMDGDQALKIV